jgi:hypothetical protein
MQRYSPCLKENYSLAREEASMRTDDEGEFMRVDALPLLNAQRDEEWRERLLSDEAVEAARSGYEVLQPRFGVDTFPDRFRAQVTAALDTTLFHPQGCSKDGGDQ